MFPFPLKFGKSSSSSSSSSANQNAMLSEMTEEWEQCERKLASSREWVSAARKQLDALVDRKRPLRDQLAVREKLAAEIGVQRSKTQLAVEKLDVHFRAKSGGGGGEGASGASAAADVKASAKEIGAELERLSEDIRAQTQNLEACLTQLDHYQRVSGTNFIYCFTIWTFSSYESWF